MTGGNKLEASGYDSMNNTGSCTNKEIRKFQMTLGNYIFFSRVICRLSSIMTVLKENYSFFCKYSKTSLNWTLLFQKVVRFSKISVYTKCRIAPANQTKLGLGGGFSDVWDRSSKPREVWISARVDERSDASK